MGWGVRAGACPHVLCVSTHPGPSHAPTPPRAATRAFTRHACVHAHPRPHQHARTVIWLPFYVIHHSPRYWEDPERFDPQRFMIPGAEYVQQPEAGQQQHEGQQQQEQQQQEEGQQQQGEGQEGHKPLQQQPQESQQQQQRPLRYLPFSHGSRDCVGQALARVSYTAMLAALLGKFHFSLAPEASE